MTKTRTAVDDRGDRVLRFQSEAHNLSRMAQLLNLIVEMFESGDWREYTTALGRQRWRACEFDYFLIASDIHHDDAAKVFTWIRRAPELAAATVSDDPRKRRPLEKASAEWISGTPETLAMRAARLGWISARGVRSAAPARARAYVRHGVTMDKHARETRKRHVHDRRAHLDQVVNQVVKRTQDETELRYVIDELQKRVGKRGRPASDYQQWASDVEDLKGNAKALAKHWGISITAAYNRKIQLKSRFKLKTKAS